MGGELGVGGGQVVEALQYFFSGAVRAAAPANTVDDACSPFMTLFTAPPSLLIGHEGDVPGQQIIFPGAPLPGQLRPQSGKIIHARDGPPPGGAGAALASRAVVDRGVPLMAMGTHPPHLPVGPDGYMRRAQGSVPGWVPLPEQLLLVILYAVLI